MLYKYYCRETFGLGMLCILSYTYFCCSVNGVLLLLLLLLLVNAPIGSSIRAFHTSTLTLARFRAQIFGIHPCLIGC